MKLPALWLALEFGAGVASGALDTNEPLRSDGRLGEAPESTRNSVNAGIAEVFQKTAAFHVLVPAGLG